MTPLALALLCLLAGALFRRQLFLMLKWVVWTALALVGLRFAGSLEIEPGLLSPLILGVFGALIGGVLAFKFINNALVERDRSGDHAGVDKKHDARLL